MTLLSSGTILLYSDKRIDLKFYAYKRAEKIFSDNMKEYVEKDVCYYENIKISDARDISTKSVESSYTGIKIFILNLDDIRIEASNALLKSIEEPVSGTFFILTSTYRDKVLPTILSRCIKEYIKPENIDVDDKIFNLLNSNLEYIEKFKNENIDIKDYDIKDLKQAYTNIKEYFEQDCPNFYQVLQYNLCIVYLVERAKFEKYQSKFYFISMIQNLFDQYKDKLFEFLNRILIHIAFKVDMKVYELLVNMKNGIKNNINKRILIYIFLNIILEEV